MKISANFTLEELTRSNIPNVPNIPDENIQKNLEKLAIKVLQPIRDKWGTVNIMSGYRCKEYNTKVGGVPNSQHTEGKAADIKLKAELSEVFAWIKRSGLMVDQCILETKNGSQWIHISYNEGHNRKQFLQADFVNGKMNYKAV